MYSRSVWWHGTLPEWVTFPENPLGLVEHGLPLLEQLALLVGHVLSRRGAEKTLVASY